MFERGDDQHFAGKAVSLVRGEFDWKQWIDAGPTCTLTMVYQEPKTGTTFGTCPVTSSMLSEEALELLTKFVKRAEEDFGKLVYGGGTSSISSDTQAETKEGLKGLGE